jgi:hypothetical protein
MIAATQTAVLNITTMKRELWSTVVVPRQRGMTRKVYPMPVALFLNRAASDCRRARC